MPTYGKSNRRSRNDPLPPTPARGARRAPAEATGPMRRRDQASAELREAVEGREDEFWGIGFIGVGVLLGLAIYFQLAGPLGRGVSTLVGWFTGLGKFIVPICLVGVGVALVRKGRSGHRFRLAIGWALTGVSILAVLHVVRRQADGFDSLGEAGGWIGALVGEPLRALLADAGAIVVLAALFLGGVMLITRTSVRTLAHQSARSVGAVAGPLSRRLRDAVGNVASLRSEREGQGELPPPSPELYDFEADDDWAAAEAPLPGRKARAPKAALPPPAGPGEQAELELGPGAQRGQWTLPPMNYLGRSTNQSVNKAEVEARGRTLVDSLASHGVETRLVGQTVGPTVTRYELELGPGVKVARITSLNRDIAYAMAATDVRILAPIPGRSAIGVEVPNHTRQLVSLGDIMTAPEAKTAAQTLDVAIGKDIAGRAVFLNLATTPHLLIAGTTGAGKSSGINCIITSLLMRTTPDQVRLILVDPKQVEMGQYNRLPHLLTAPVTNPKKAANALGWACKEMDRRYDLLFEVGFRDISGYNAAFDRGELVGEPGSDKVYERLPFIVVVVDELNDLMMVAARDVEESITRIAQKARAVGIHLIVATQRPSVNVITGVIKANIPARIAYAVNSLTDSRVILDQPGAEKLVGKGDMLLLPGNSNVSQRIQGSFVSEEEVRKVVAHWRRQAPEVVYVSGVEGDEGEGQLGGGGGFGGGDDDEDEALMRQAMELVVRSQLGSTSMLQRKLKVGFARAGRIMDLLEQRGVVGPSEGSKARAVLMTVEEYELLYPQRGG
ncbi:MAG: DNA translocase FtsK 4TM domain-containing protein [Acidimicrobiaceae bacterium]|nr:DNA translocase FtsK 4TM domain-containing protein [Ilumatobacter sp.]MCB9379629.1 DNA translocase FtsK 4TM domain-containing protein [Acidimicrobiaceae bacterium]